MSIKVVVNAAGFMNADLEAQKAIDKLHRHGFDVLSETEKTNAGIPRSRRSVAQPPLCPTHFDDLRRYAIRGPHSRPTVKRP